MYKFYSPPVWPELFWKEKKVEVLQDSSERFFICENYYVNFWLKERAPNKYLSCRKMETRQGLHSHAVLLDP